MLNTKQKSNEILYSSGNNDECYTPDYAVSPILKYIKPNSVVWCPFDKKESEFVKQIGLRHKVIYSHIHDGQNFFNYEPEEHWDCIISNPPFTNKRKIFERAISFGKPFALIMSNTWLNDNAPQYVFGNELQLLMFNKRIHFIQPDGKEMNRPTFASSYFCWQFLPQQIICESLEYKQRNLFLLQNSELPNGV